MRTRIKICGITSAQDAEAAVAAGADAVGVVLAVSPRRVSLEEAVGVFAAVPLPVARIGVFVDPSAEQVLRAADALRLAAVQLSGHEPAEFCARMPIPVVKAIHVGPEFTWDEVEAYRGCVSAILLDTAWGDEAGGTGRSFGWPDAAPVPDGLTVFVAGGLNPANVGLAIDGLHPFAVDVSSGVEESPGHKDPLKMQAFVAAVRAADEKG